MDIQSPPSKYRLMIFAAMVLFIAPALSHSALLPQLDMPDEADIVIGGAQWMGTAICNAGDVNGDGIADIAVTATGASPASNHYAGAAYIIYGGRQLESFINPFENADLTVNGSIQDARLGDSISTGGDINGDGNDDIAIGCVKCGKVYVFLGIQELGIYDAEEDADIILSKGTSGGDFGRTLEIGGDVNGDGIDDIVVGAPYENSGGGETGAVYIYYGRDPWPDTRQVELAADVLITSGEVPDSYIGWAIASDGDVNNDKVDDILLGVPDYEGGRGYLIYGEQDLPNSIDAPADADVILKTTEGVYWKELGYAVCTSGDINGDGIKDIVISDTSSSPKDAYEGQVYVLFGSAGLQKSIDVYTEAQIKIMGTYDNVLMGAALGEALSSGGDVNGDGIDDLLISGTFTGYCVRGRRDWPPVVDMAVEADSELDTFAIFRNAVCNKGDVNGDGMADLLGGYNCDWAEEKPGVVYGAAFMVYGNPLPLGLAVLKNSVRQDNARIFHYGDTVTLQYEIHPSEGAPSFYNGKIMEAALGVQVDPDAPSPTGGGAIQVYKPGLKELVPLPSDFRTLTMTFSGIAFPPAGDPLVGRFRFTVPNAPGKYCFIGAIYDPEWGRFPAGIVRSNIFYIDE